ncbi:MAG: hypothetical protein P8104_04455, partial [Gammaproteobacteria bacterium]
MSLVDPRLSRQDECFDVKGPAGSLAVIVTRPTSEILCRNKGVVMIGHPHPQMGGTMHNKVVQTIARAARDQGLTAVRFNFRGVEGSEGEFAHGEGEVEDFLAVYRWVLSTFQFEQSFFTGFSFGSCVAALAFHRLLPRDLSPDGVILVAPPVERMPFASLPRFDVPCQVIQGEADETVIPESVYAWQAQRPDIPIEALWRLPEADHFFHGKLGP